MSDGLLEILLIEDDPDDAEFITATLMKDRPDARILHIGDGEAALKYLYNDGNAAPRLILLDLRMPKVDGIQILRQLKQDLLRQHIPVIVMVSSLDAGRNYVESFQLSADAYVCKPVMINDFRNAVSQIGVVW